MPERNSYQPGEFCWSDMGTKDIDAMVSFYTSVFGWKAENVMPPEASVDYFMMRQNGKDVTAIGWKNDPSPQMLGPYIAVTDADATAARARELGANVIVEPFDIDDSGRMAVLQDPTGAVISLWQAGTGIGATLRDEPGSMCWFELNASDLDLARDFYTNMFGYSVDDISDETIAYNVLLLDSLPEEQRSVAGIYSSADLPKGWTVCFAVDDADAHVERIRHGGGKVLSEPVDTPYGRFAVAQDPGGATFSVMKMAEAPTG
jgi:predicted enzyme related to lactoylglutathione lyase